MNNKIIQILLALLCLNLILSAKSINDMDSVKVAKAIGFSMTRENYSKNIDLRNVENKLSSYIKDNGFYFTAVFVNWSEKRGMDLHVKGIIVHKDDLNRNIETKFTALCKVFGDKIAVNNVELRNNAKPRSAFYIVPSYRIDLESLSSLSFEQALKRVQNAAKKLDNNTQMDMQPKDYTFVAFLMNKLDQNDTIKPLVSSKAYYEVGQEGVVIQTTDNWRIAAARTQFAYNNFQPKYFNILWKKDNILRVPSSFTTHTLVKSIQLALQNKGYDVGAAEGILNDRTENAVRRYLRDKGFDPDSQISASLLWFINHGDNLDINKTVQTALLIHGKNIGVVDGKIGSRTIRALKEYQKRVNFKPDGKVTPEIVYFLLQTSKNINVYQKIRTLFPKPVLMKRHQNKIWPNEA
jgi:peptidoglycan hydrolase-like protein with peptidoglycan-binding domain